MVKSAKIIFCHIFWLRGPIDLRSPLRNCILHDLFRDTPLNHIWFTKVCTPNTVFGVFGCIWRTCCFWDCLDHLLAWSVTQASLWQDACQVLLKLWSEIESVTLKVWASALRTALYTGYHKVSMQLHYDKVLCTVWTQGMSQCTVYTEYVLVRALLQNAALPAAVASGQHVWPSLAQSHPADAQKARPGLGREMSSWWSQSHLQ